MAIFKTVIKGGKGVLIELDSEKFYSEKKDLHKIIEKNPEIIIPKDLKGKKFEVFHEFKIKSGYIDFLYVFEDGSILIVEAKLSKNQEINRYVIAQVLNYASDLSKIMPENFISLLKNQGLKLEDFLLDKLFEEKLVRGLKRKITMEIITDDDIANLNRISGFISEISRDVVSICIAEIKRYKNPEILEVNIRYPKSSAEVDITKTDREELISEIGKKHPKEAEEIEKAMDDLPSGWNLDKYSFSNHSVFVYKHEGESRFILKFNPKSDFIILQGTREEYSKIKALFDKETVLKNQPNSKRLFGIVKFNLKGITCRRIIEILDKVDESLMVRDYEILKKK